MFVFTDVWRLAYWSAPNGASRSRGMLYAVYTRGVKACSLTTFATIMSFLSNVFSPISALREFGVFMSLCLALVLLNTVLFWPPVLLLYTNLQKRRAKGRGEQDPDERLDGMMHAEPMSPITPALAGSAEKNQLWQVGTRQATRGIVRSDSGEHVRAERDAFNFNGTWNADGRKLTVLSNRVVGLRDDDGEYTVAMEGEQPCVVGPGGFRLRMKDFSDDCNEITWVEDYGRRKDEQQWVRQFRPLENFLYNRWAKVLAKYRAAILGGFAFSLFIVIVLTIVTVKFSTSLPDVFPEEHNQNRGKALVDALPDAYERIGTPPSVLGDQMPGRTCDATTHPLTSGAFQWDGSSLSGALACRDTE